MVILHLPDDTDFDALGDRLEELGYTRPTDETGRLGGRRRRSRTRIGADLTPELQYLALDADAGLVLASDTSGYLEQAVGRRRDGDGAPAELREVAAASGDPLSAAVYDGDYTCSPLAMAQADPDDQATADELLRDAGKVNPVTGFAMSAQPDGHVRVVLSFENDDQARTNADTRAALASGPGPGPGRRLRRPVPGGVGHRRRPRRHLRPGPPRGRLRALGPEHRPAALRHLLSPRAGRGGLPARRPARAPVRPGMRGLVPNRAYSC